MLDLNKRISLSFTETLKKPKVWIFQANPNLYKIKDSLQKEEEEFWNLNQHYKEIEIGDRVLIWISGSDAGIYALGTVMTSPSAMTDSVTGMKYWVSKEKGKRIVPRVLVKYDKKFTDNPLLKVFLQCDPSLWNLLIIRSPRGTNFRVTSDEWEALKFWLNE